MIEKLFFYFEYPFVRYALIVGVLIALCSSLLGVTLVLKRFSFIGDGLSHVAFGAMAVASVLKLTNNMLFILPVTVLCAILLLRTGQKTKIKGDDFCRGAGNRVSVNEHFLYRTESLRRCMQYIVWINIDPDIDNESGGVVLHTVCNCCCCFCSVLSSNFLRNL